MTKRKTMKRILILGATSSVAAEVAAIYARDGAQLYLIARNPEKLAALTKRLGPAVVGYEHFDFNDTARNAPAIQRAFSQLGVVDITLVAQGVLGDQERSEQDFDEAAHTINTNYTNVVSQLIVLANLLQKQGCGRLAVIASVAGDRGRPRNYTYASAKSALVTYLQGLRARLWPAVQVHTIKLGPVDTPMTEHHKKTAVFTTSQKAAEGIVTAIRKGQKEAYVPSFWRPIMLVVRNLPQSAFQRLSVLSAR